MTKLSTKMALCFGFIWSICGSTVYAQNNAGAYLEQVSNNQTISMGWLIPPYATVSIVDENDQIYASYIDNGSGRVITALRKPDTYFDIFASFYSDNTGLSSRVPLNFSQDTDIVLMPPTIYSMRVVKALGFVGNVYPGSSIELEIDSYTNEKRILNGLADRTGEWQISPIDISPGNYQIRARANYEGQVSDWSQIMVVQVLTPLDQAIEDLGKQTRNSVEMAFGRLPAPLKSVAEGLDNNSTGVTKYLLPSLLTLSTLATSGILLQNVIYLIYQSLIAFLQFLGIMKKRQEMGVIYDSITKKPLGRAIVRLYESANHRLVETDVTTDDGTFSFMPPEGFYYLKVSKPKYIFPTRLILGSRDGRYNHVYLNGEIQIGGDKSIVKVAVPMDPEAFEETWMMKLSRFWQRWFEPANTWLLLFGFFLSILSYSRDSSRLNFVILWLYLIGVIYFGLRGKTFRRDFGLVVSDRGKPMAGIELNLVDVEYNRLVSRRVSDIKGRYQFFVPPGKYLIKMVTPAFKLALGAKKTYQGQELLVEGDKGQTKRVIPKIVIKKV